MLDTKAKTTQEQTDPRPTRAQEGDLDECQDRINAILTNKIYQNLITFLDANTGFATMRHRTKETTTLSLLNELHSRLQMFRTDFVCCFQTANVNDEMPTEPQCYEVVAYSKWGGLKNN